MSNDNARSQDSRWKIACPRDRRLGPDLASLIMIIGASFGHLLTNKPGAASGNVGGTDVVKAVRSVQAPRSSSALSVPVKFVP